ncbi:uncharacterized protein EI90DRAFT_2685433 [Cantharellus anzutake]|uniref:uncharacterized protein n=1 Tax=Cantharellus anzutake TaxID=1750568 RepID=UPI0019041728|nr:uncharacterized protein EI90DRAFT_2685433 [Cantharellus anzutake]KAF8319169.1 hypothetical protein EI90DRAFT_2685433 [Cantharellus anzutake]
MRLWILFAPLALVPIVAASFYVGRVNCKGYSYGAMVPSSSNDLSTATNYDSQAFQWGSTSMTGPICRTIVTITDYQWTSTGGDSGICLRTEARRSSARFDIGPFCEWQDHLLCYGDLCEN